MLADLSAGGGQAQVLSWGVNFTAVPEPINVALGVFGGARWGFTGCAGGGDVPDPAFPDCRHREAVSPTVCAASPFELLASPGATYQRKSQPTRCCRPAAGIEVVWKTPTPPVAADGRRLQSLGSGGHARTTVSAS